MTRHYASLWDRSYMSKGLCLYESLSQHSSEPFTLHVLGMDDATIELLYELKLPDVDILPIQAFEYAMHLGGIRKQRTWQEFCWTAASQLMEYLMPWVDDGVTYLDSDLFFFADPEVVFIEIGERSIGITPHRFPPDKLDMEKNGKFNVGWVTIKNTDAGRRCVAKWAAQCRERCSVLVGCGDQLYLDSFMADYPGEVCAIENIGVNVAPWNVVQYEIFEDPNGEKAPRLSYAVVFDQSGAVVHGGPGVRGAIIQREVVFYHMHEFAEREDGTFRLTNYPLTDSVVRCIYRPYVEQIQAAKERIAEAERVMAERKAEMELQAERA